MNTNEAPEKNAAGWTLFAYRVKLSPRRPVVTMQRYATSREAGAASLLAALRETHTTATVEA